MTYSRSPTSPAAPASSAPHPLLELDYLRSRVFPFLPPAAWNRVVLPHYGFGHVPAADFHDTLSTDLHNFHRTRDRGRAYIAPRGGAKSTTLTFAYALRCAVSGWEPHVLILSETDPLAAKFLGDIKAELEINPRIAKLYPQAAGAGAEWSENRIRLPNGVLIEALGRGVRIRGRKNRAARPSLVILDDVQSNRDIVSATDRKRAWDWLAREVIPAGDERTNFLSVGSAIHREAIAVRAMSLPGWTGRTFRAVHEWPTRMDLWEEFARLATNLADEARDDTARRFYADNRPEMDRGADTYWPGKWPLLALMRRWAQIGATAFGSEYQGDPHAVEGVEWNAALFDRDGFWFDRWPEDLVLKLQALDPSKGVTCKPGDYQGHVWGGVSRNGTFYLDADARRETDYVGRMLTIGESFRPEEIWAESNNTMGLLRPEVERQMEARRNAGRWVPPLYKEVYHSEPKLTRVRRVNTYLNFGQVRVRNTSGGRTLVDQWRDFPAGEYDDLPDAAGTLIVRAQQILRPRG